MSLAIERELSTRDFSGAILPLEGQGRVSQGSLGFVVGPVHRPGRPDRAGEAAGDQVNGGAQPRESVPSPWIISSGTPSRRPNTS